MTMRAICLLSALCLLNCSSSRVRGGSAELPENAPRGTLEARLVPTDCRDARGHSVPNVQSRVEVMRLADDRRVLLEHRAGYDVLVVTNVWSADDARVFQVLLKGGNFPATLREFRISRTRGTLSVADSWREDSRSNSEFRATFSAIALRCSLMPSDHGSMLEEG